jgi:hypothetical protein
LLTFARNRFRFSRARGILAHPMVMRRFLTAEWRYLVMLNYVVALLAGIKGADFPSSLGLFSKRFDPGIDITKIRCLFGNFVFPILPLIFYELSKGARVLFP